MSDGPNRFERYWPRRGIMATEAGRRVVSGVVLLTAAAFVITTLALGLLLLAASLLGVLDGAAVGHLALGMGGGLLTIIVAFLILPALGRLSKLGDEVRMLELCDPGAPLLHELMDRAPGTYNHSIMTGTLAEAGAREIGASALLARTGAYYHDVGKLMRPYFFVENQQGGRNPHDDAPPEQSAFIITAHVREGVELAERARLPRPVVAIIGEHHGDSLVTYFYRKAAACDLRVDETDFRYDGVRPKTKEAALVMLADAAEAAGRSLVDCGPAQIEKAVRRVVASKVADGQIADSGLTEDDVETVVHVYAKMLTGQRHERVQYGDEDPD
jgi:cyclic-di-AMP phosphodiesterase PgpH